MFRDELDELTSHFDTTHVGIQPRTGLYLHIHPADSTTDLDELELKIRELDVRGVEWRIFNKHPMAFGLYYLAAACSVEERKTTVETLVEEVTNRLPNHIASITVMNRIDLTPSTDFFNCV